MLETYFTIAMVLMTISIFAAVIMTIIWSIDGRRERRTNARLTLWMLAGIPLAWIWPLTVPAIIVYIISRLVNDANLPNN